MPDEKDRFGDKLRDAERGREDEFFAKRDRHLLEKMRTEKTATSSDAGSAARCPKCAAQLTSRSHLGVTVDECTHCGGVWIDKAHVEELARRESAGWLARYLGRPR